MYHHLRGKLVERGSLDVVLEVAGVGWQLRVPLSTSGALQGKEDAEVALFTHLLVREDDLRLFGFSTRGERQVFRLLLSVSRMGPSLALQALSACSASEIIASLGAGDIAMLCRIKGVGRKLAERLVLELKEKATLLSHELRMESDGGGDDARSAVDGERVVESATAALTELGYLAKDAKRRVEGAFETLAADDGTDRVGVEAVIREALRRS